MRYTKFPSLARLPQMYRQRVIESAQQDLAEYLHSTRSIPYVVAEHICKHSIISICTLINQLSFPNSSRFSSSLKKFLLYHPVNELEFFYESLGIDYDKVKSIIPPKRFFLSEDSTTVDAASELFNFGFPWTSLGILYSENPGIFLRNRDELVRNLNQLKEYGFGAIQAIGICFAFPKILSEDWDDEFAKMCNTLKLLLLYSGLENCVEATVDAWCELCRKFRVIYDLGRVSESTEELISMPKRILTDHPLEVLIRKVDFFSGFRVPAEEVRSLILQKPEVLDFDLDSRIISVEAFLLRSGMRRHKVRRYSEKYPHVFGRNKLSNLPNIMRALDLNFWFFDLLKNEKHHLLGRYKVNDTGETEEYRNLLREIEACSTRIYSMSRLRYLHELGFGQNAITIKAMKIVHGSPKNLEERVGCFLISGIEFSKLHLMIRGDPKILNLPPETIEMKLGYLRKEMGLSLEYLVTCPALLRFSLEKRVIPRHRFFRWLEENGVPGYDFGVSSIVASSEKKLLSKIYRIYPPALKHYLERFFNVRFVWP